jgi:hypothetical protein
MYVRVLRATADRAGASRLLEFATLFDGVRAWVPTGAITFRGATATAQSGLTDLLALLARNLGPYRETIFVRCLLDRLALAGVVVRGVGSSRAGSMGFRGAVPVRVLGLRGRLNHTFLGGSELAGDAISRPARDDRLTLASDDLSDVHLFVEVLLLELLLGRLLLHFVGNAVLALRPQALMLALDLGVLLFLEVLRLDHRARVVQALTLARNVLFVAQRARVGYGVCGALIALDRLLGGGRGVRCVVLNGGDCELLVNTRLGVWLNAYLRRLMLTRLAVNALGLSEFSLAQGDDLLNEVLDGALNFVLHKGFDFSHSVVFHAGHSAGDSKLKDCHWLRVTAW